MRTDLFFTPSGDVRVEEARLALLESHLDPAAFVDLAFGREAALVMADAGVPVAPLHRATFKPLAPRTVDIDRTWKAFTDAPRALVGYDVSRAPFHALVSTSSLAAYRVLVEAVAGSAPDKLGKYLLGISFMPAPLRGHPVVRLFPATDDTQGFVHFDAAGVEAVQFLAPTAGQRSARRQRQITAVPAGLVLAVASDPGSRQTLLRFYGRAD